MSEFDALKKYIYGLGRYSGIRLQPRHHVGELQQQVQSVAIDVCNADAIPTDASLGPIVVNAKEVLRRLLAHHTPDAQAVESAIRDYIRERLAIIMSGWET